MNKNKTLMKILIFAIISFSSAIISELDYFQRHIFFENFTFSDVFRLIYWFFFFIIGYLLFKRMDCVKRLKLEQFESTNDIKVLSKSFKGSINNMDGLSLIRFFFNDEKIYLVYRNYFPIKIYYGPFIISRNKNHTDLKIEKFELYKNDAFLIIINNNFEKHSFRMTNINESDLVKIRTYFTEELILNNN